MTNTRHLAVLLAFSFAACQNVPPEVATTHHSVINGHSDSGHPAVVVLLMTVTAGQALCTGTVIAKDWVLTAGHCAAQEMTTQTCQKSGGCTVAALTPGAYQVYFGSTLSSPTFSTSVTEVHLHQGFIYPYGSSVPKNDIALLKIASQPASLTPVAALPTSLKVTNSDVGQDVTVVGFGETVTDPDNNDPQGTHTGTKMYGTSNISSVCNVTSGSCSDYDALPGTMCYNGNPGLICSGDSGGPDLIVRSGTTYVASVHSYGDLTCTSFACSTIVDQFTSFIQGYIGTQYPNGHSCSSPQDCLNGFCVNSVCCDRDCSGGCERCSGSGVAVAGTCQNVEGLACNDSNPCTDNDACHSGSCYGTPKNCGSSSNPCVVGAVCNIGTGACEGGGPAADGTACNDGNPCTINDACHSGTCAGTQKSCSGGGACVTGGTCNPSTGNCQGGSPLPDGTSCDDGNPCTLNDTCHSGTCSPGTQKSCAANPCVSGAYCNLTTGACEGGSPAADGTYCDDGNLCTVNDGCKAGVCTGTAKDCSGGNGACTKGGKCNPVSGACEGGGNFPDGTTCDDNNACTSGETCHSGVCSGGTQTSSCPAPDACHLASTCNSSSGKCNAFPNAPDGTACDDGDPCTTGDKCQAGVCKPGTPVSCPPPDACHDNGTCANGQCTGVYPMKADGTACDDGNVCTTNDTCHSGVCKGTATNGSCGGAADPCHNAGACANGQCNASSKPDGTPCDDGNPNTQNDQCTSGHCAGTLISAPCYGKANGTPCDDGNKCTVNDSCYQNACSGDTKACPKPTQCKQAPGQCDWQTGNCVYLSKPNNTECDDGDPNTTDDVCINGNCVGTPVGPVQDCTGQADGTQCTTGTCQSGQCVGGATGDAGTEPSPRGSCGCGTGSAPTSLLLAAVAMIALARRRRFV